jgi:hypothetical protein
MEMAKLKSLQDVPGNVQFGDNDVLFDNSEEILNDDANRAAPQNFESDEHCQVAFLYLINKITVKFKMTVDEVRNMLNNMPYNGGKNQVNASWNFMDLRRSLDDRTLSTQVSFNKLFKIKTYLFSGKNVQTKLSRTKSI